MSAFRMHLGLTIAASLREIGRGSRVHDARVDEISPGTARGPSCSADNLPAVTACQESCRANFKCHGRLTSSVEPAHTRGLSGSSTVLVRLTTTLSLSRLTRRRSYANPYRSRIARGLCPALNRFAGPKLDGALRHSLRPRIRRRTG